MTTPTTTAPSDAGTQAGFTLIEMLVVLGIMSLLAAIAVGAMQRRPDRFGRAQSEVDVRSAIEAAGAQARASGAPVQIDLAKLGVRMAGPPASLTLYPDGSTSGGVVERAGRPLVTIDWFTGRVLDAK